jgi:3-hydroxyisobutyrate dehydrogenase
MPEPASQKSRVAVIGLGSMGFGMATSLRRAGFEVTGCDVTAETVARFVADGGHGAKTPAEAAKEADIVVSVVVNAAQTETILFGKDGVAETLAKGAVFVSSATMDPDVARRLARQLEATGRHYLDAPISGGARRRANSRFSPPAAKPHLTERGPRSMRWRQNSTSLGTLRGRAQPSR